MLAFKSLAFYFCVYGEAIQMSKGKAAKQRLCESAWFNKQQRMSKGKAAKQRLCESAWFSKMEKHEQR